MGKQMHCLLLGAVFAAVILPAVAQASPAYMKLGDIKGEATETIEVESWSWGASSAAAAPNQNSSRSNHTRSTDGAGGEAPSSEAMHRDHASGMATGKRQHTPIRISSPLAQDGTVRIVSPREQSSGQATGKRSACVVGTHIATAKLERESGSVVLTDLTVTECNADGMTMSYKTAEDLPVRPPEPDAVQKGATKSRSNIQNN